MSSILNHSFHVTDYIHQHFNQLKDRYMVRTMKYIKVLHQEVQQPLQQPSLVKDRNEARESNMVIHPSIHFLYPLVLCIVKRGFSQHALGERQASNGSQVNGSTVSQSNHGTTRDHSASTRCDKACPSLVGLTVLLLTYIVREGTSQQTRAE